MFIHAGGHRLEYEMHRPSRPTDAHGIPHPMLVFLHEGLGAVAMWRDWPARLCQATGRPAVVCPDCRCEFVPAEDGPGGLSATPLISSTGR